MKRHPSLEPFSRDHNVGLTLARQAVRAAPRDEESRRRAAVALVQCWNDELEDHFMEEERLLGPLVPTFELHERLMNEHREFAQDIALLVAGEAGPELLAHAGRILNDHIRWEERVLFPEIENTATEERLHELSEKTECIEDRRSESTWSPRRGELMKRRDAR